MVHLLPDQKTGIRDDLPVRLLVLDPAGDFLDVVVSHFPPEIEEPEVEEPEAEAPAAETETPEVTE